jgi:hypothetical protein
MREWIERWIGGGLPASSRGGHVTVPDLLFLAGYEVAPCDGCSEPPRQGGSPASDRAALAFSAAPNVSLVAKCTIPT